MTFGTLEKEFIEENQHLLDEVKQIPEISYSKGQKGQSKSKTKEKTSPRNKNINVNKLKKK